MPPHLPVENLEKFLLWASDNELGMWHWRYNDDGIPYAISLETPSGLHYRIAIGDYIISDGDGEFGFCSPTTFEATYEAVDD